MYYSHVSFSTKLPSFTSAGQHGHINSLAERIQTAFSPSLWWNSLCGLHSNYITWGRVKIIGSVWKRMYWCRQIYSFKSHSFTQVWIIHSLQTHFVSSVISARVYCRFYCFQPTKSEYSEWSVNPFRIFFAKKKKFCLEKCEQAF